MFYQSAHFRFQLHVANRFKIAPIQLAQLWTAMLHDKQFPKDPRTTGREPRPNTGKFNWWGGLWHPISSGGKLWGTVGEQQQEIITRLRDNLKDDSTTYYLVRKNGLRWEWTSSFEPIWVFDIFFFIGLVHLVRPSWHNTINHSGEIHGLSCKNIL